MAATAELWMILEGVRPFFGDRFGVFLGVFLFDFLKGDLCSALGLIVI